jgi:vacuolar-type H+-ATPase subunit E/Vma4
MNNQIAQIKEYNCETGIETIRDATDEELEQIKIDAENAASRAQAEAERAQAKAALLDRLGITEAEAKLLLS